MIQSQARCDGEKSTRPWLLPSLFADRTALRPNPIVPINPLPAPGIVVGVAGKPYGPRLRSRVESRLSLYCCWCGCVGVPTCGPFAPVRVHGMLGERSDWIRLCHAHCVVASCKAVRAQTTKVDAASGRELEITVESFHNNQAKLAYTLPHIYGWEA